MTPAPRRPIHHPNPAMKIASLSLVTAVGLACLAALSCNPADPSAIQEGQKALAETMAKNMRLNDEIAALKTQLDQAKTEVEKANADRDAALAKPAKAQETKMPTAAEVEAKLDVEVAKLKDEARQKNPGAKVEGLSTWDVTSPGETPYSCKAKVALTNANGTRQTLYWTGSANLKGDWIFKQAENLETKQPETATAAATGTAPPPEPPKTVAKKDEPKEPPPEPKETKKPDADNGFKPPVLTIVKDGDKRGLKDQPKQPDRPQQPDTPEKPKQKFDIDLKKPVMGPGSK